MDDQSVVFRPAPPVSPLVGRWVLVCVGLGVLASVVDHFAHSGWGPLVSIPLSLVGVVGAGALAQWAETRWFFRFARRTVAERLVVVLLSPLGALMLMTLALVLFSAVPGPALGFTRGLRFVVVLFTLWFSGACLGSAVVLLLDVGISRLVSSFRSRIIAAVMALLALATLINVAVVVLITTSFAQLGKRAVDGPVKVNGASIEEVADYVFGHPTLVGLGAFAVAFVLAFPAALSACLRLGDAVMERLAPLGLAFDAVAKGQRLVRVEEGGSRDFIEVSQRFNSMMGALEQSERMERAFGVYVSGHVLERIRSQHGRAAIPAALKDASVFFADIRGFTSASEKLGPEQVLAFLNRYFTQVVALVDAHEGYLNKFIGDAVVVIFNGPLDQPDHAARAVRCALALQDEVKRLNAEGAFPEVGELKVGVGVSTGPMVCGNVGAATQMEYSVIGDTVNLAARLTSQAPAGEVWVSEPTVASLPEGVVADALEPIKVKGKEQLVRPSRVRRVAAAA